MKNRFELIYITNNKVLAKYADFSDVDYVMVDLETVGKFERQTGKNTWISDHRIEDVAKIKKVLSKSKLLVRINPLSDSSPKEISKAIDFGADAIMLPMFSDKQEVERFLKLVNFKAETILLVETKEAISNLNDVLSVVGNSKILFGLNDLSMSLKNKFLFEPLVDGIIEKSIELIKNNCADNIYGFGGIGSLGKGVIPSETLIVEHKRLNSRLVILSRSFLKDLLIINNKHSARKFKREVMRIRDIYEVEYSAESLEDNRNLIESLVREHVANSK